MCELCVAEAIHIGYLFNEPTSEKTELSLEQALADGDIFKKGDYGLVYVNRPEIVWHFRCEEWQSQKNYDEIQENFNVPIRVGYDIYKDCLKNGFKEFEEEYKIEEWILERCAVLVEIFEEKNEFTDNQVLYATKEGWKYYTGEELKKLYYEVNTELKRK